MTLKSVYETAEEIPEALKEYYPENNGKFVFAGAEGWKPQSEVDKVMQVLESERKLTKQFKATASVWESKLPGKTADEVAALLERIPLLEAESQGRVDPVKHTQILETTVKQRMAPLEHELGKLKQSVVEREQEIAAYKSAERRRTIHDAVRAVAAKEGFQETTYSSPEGTLMLLAERHLVINSVGDVVVSDDSKLLTPGLPVREALVEIKNQQPYMLKQSIGGGASGSAPGSAGSAQNPFRGNNITARAQFMRENAKDPSKIEFLWKQAGLSGPLEMHKAK